MSNIRRPETALDPEEVKHILRAAGLWMDLTRGLVQNGWLKDQWGWLLQNGDKQCFVTRTVFNPCHDLGQDVLLCNPSQVIWHDGPQGWHHYGEWEKCGDHLEKREVRVPGATFALTGRLGVPERVFLFLSDPKFLVINVTLSLDYYVATNPPPRYGYDSSKRP
jgi:hypothetical protein